MKSKVLINARRKRRIPKHFSWVDHRLVRKNYLKRCSTDALALYLFLITVGDHEGLSYYSDGKITRYLNFSSSSDVMSSRKELINADLIAYSAGIYQVLDIGDSGINVDLKFKEALNYGRTTASAVNSGENIGTVLDRMFGGE